ncbi:MAG: hypothetical protein KAU20_06530 [Nanoarchaeota archaeon]|nr:hypothetical protein [Nanoarchaeota archaeon]
MIRDIIKDIDRKCEFPKVIEKLFKNRLTNNQQEELFWRLVHATRYACLLDYYHETNNILYLHEGQKQKENLFSRLPNKTRYNLEDIENKIISFFQYEKEVIAKIEQQHIFSDKDIKNYIKKRSSDSIYYEMIIEDFIPDNDIPSNALRCQLALYDVLKDLSDYENDLQDRHPNILVMLLLSKKITKFPTSSLETLCKVKTEIRQIADSLKKEGLSEPKIRSYPLLIKDIEDKYQKLTKEAN